jgi:hypothetical protein
MKRASTTITRQTRSVTRRLQVEAEQNQQEELRHQELCERATSLMETPQLRALPLVLSKSGFLYKYECLRAAETCKFWLAIYKEVKNELPEASLVEIKVSYGRTGNRDGVVVPDWVTEQGLKNVLGTSEFVRQVFDRVNELKVAAKTSKKQKEKARAGLPKWGLDFHAATLIVWGPSHHNDGGIHISLHRDCSRDKFPNRVELQWKIRLDPDLILWTGIRAWRVYNFEPLWP